MNNNMNVEKVIEELTNLKSRYNGFNTPYTEVLDNAIQIIRELQNKENEMCEWTLIDEDFNGYDTSCRSPWYLESGTPSDNKMNYCPYCGRKIKVVE